MSTNPVSERTDDCEAILDLIPEYAFGLTEDDQARWVEANLQRCPDAAARLDEYRRIQDEMRLGVPQVEPSAALGTRLMAAVAAQAEPAREAAAPVETPLPHAPLLPLPQTQAKPRRSFRIGWTIAAAAVLALVATNVYWLTRVADLTQSNNLLTALTNPQNSPFVLTSTESLHWVRLADPQPDGSASAFMMWNAQSKTGLLYARNLPELQPNYKYHVWLTRPGGRVFMGLLQVDAEGDGALLFNSPEPINDFAWAWITAETGNGQPDAPAVVKGELNPA